MADAILFGPFIGEFYWEAGRFAPILPYYTNRKYLQKPIKYIIFTREERFDLYGKRADIFVPLRIEGDYDKYQPECFRLLNFNEKYYYQLAEMFKNKYAKQYNILEHVFPSIDKGRYCNKNQYDGRNYIFDFAPRTENYELVEKFLPNNLKKNVIISPRYRVGFRRNWGKWDKLYALISNDSFMMNNFNFIICGKPGEYIPDEKKRFYDMNDIQLGSNSSLSGILLAIMEKSVLTVSSQSAIPNISLLKGVEVLEFGCQKALHTNVYNPKKTPITFIEDLKYSIEPTVLFDYLKRMLKNKKKGITNDEKRKSVVASK